MIWLGLGFLCLVVGACIGATVMALVAGERIHAADERAEKLADLLLAATGRTGARPTEQ